MKLLKKSLELMVRLQKFNLVRINGKLELNESVLDVVIGFLLKHGFIEHNDCEKTFIVSGKISEFLEKLALWK